MDTYKKKYEKAFEKARNIVNSINVGLIGKDSFEAVFPELAESEDEKVRKKLINIVKKSYEQGGYALHKWEADEMLAWLEKQGKIVDYYEDKLDECACKYFNKGYKHALEKQGELIRDTDTVDSNEDGLIAETIRYKNEKQGEQKLAIEMITPEESLGIDSETYSKIVDECIYGEQKPSDKVEPKFKVGDWVVYKDAVWKVCNISLQNYYELLKINNEVSTRLIKNVDKNAHLWTIKDLKIMEQYIDKSALVAEIEKRIKELQNLHKENEEKLDSIQKTAILLCIDECRVILSFINTLEVKDPYEQTVQYDSIKAGIQAYAETYSFNIESLLFNQLTKEQQALWRKEIEQAVISGGEVGYELAKDPRYKENVKVKEVDLEKELESWRHNHFHGRRDKEASGEYLERVSQLELAKHFFELGLKLKKGE